MPVSITMGAFVFKKEPKAAAQQLQAAIAILCTPECRGNSSGPSAHAGQGCAVSMHCCREMQCSPTVHYMLFSSHEVH